MYVNRKWKDRIKIVKAFLNYSGTLFFYRNPKFIIWLRLTLFLSPQLLHRGVGSSDNFK